MNTRVSRPVVFAAVALRCRVPPRTRPVGIGTVGMLSGRGLCPGLRGMEYAEFIRRQMWEPDGPGAAVTPPAGRGRSFRLGPGARWQGRQHKTSAAVGTALVRGPSVGDVERLGVRFLTKEKKKKEH